MGRIIEGDCLEIMKDMADNSVDSIFADLPFYQNWQEEIDDIEFKELTASEKKIINYKIWNKKLADESYRVLRDGGNLVIVNAPKYILETASIWLDSFTFRSQVPLIRKGSLRPAWMLGFRHNIMLFLVKGDKKSKWYGATTNHDKEQFTDVWDDIPYQNGFRGRGLDNWHPEAINIEVVERALKLIAKEGDTILDPCFGSGTTGVAAVKNGMNYIGIESNPKYFKIAKKRLSQEHLL